MVLATMLPFPGAKTAASEPSKVDLENLVPATLNYETGVLDPLHQAQKAAEKKAAAESLVHQKPLEQEEVRPAEVSVSRESVQPAQAPGDCSEAIRATWPQSLWAGAEIVLAHENPGRNPSAIGKPNSDPWHSQDFGCFQVNNHWHAGFFATHNWADPYQNAAYAYQIYAGRGNWSAWYAVQGILW